VKERGLELDIFLSIVSIDLQIFPFLLTSYPIGFSSNLCVPRKFDIKTDFDCYPLSPMSLFMVHGVPIQA
jgi:hypothetical protein